MAGPSDLLNMSGDELAQGIPEPQKSPTEILETPPAATPMVQPALKSGAEALNAGAGMNAGSASQGQPGSNGPHYYDPVTPAMPPLSLPPAIRPMPTAPKMEPTPTPTMPALPVLADFKPASPVKHEPTALERAKADTSYKEPHSIIDSLLVGIGGGVANVGAQGQALGKLLSGHITKNANEDWQRQYEAAIPKEWRDELPYKAGEMLGQTGAYAATTAATGLAAAAAGFSAPVAGAAAIGGAALEGGAFGVAGHVQQQAYEGQRPKFLDTAGAAALGAGLGAFGGAVGMGLQKGVTSILRKRALTRALAKRATTMAARMKRDLAAAAKLAEDIESELIKQEAAQVAAVKQILHSDGPLSPIAKKQAEDMAKLASAGTPPPAAAHEPGGPTRAPLVRKGYEAIANATPIADVITKLPEALGKEFTAALHELGEAKVLVAHLENRVEAYAKNAYNLAKDATQRTKAFQREEKKLTSKAAGEISQARSEEHLAQMQARENLESQLNAATAELQSTPQTLSEHREALFAKINAIKAMLKPLQAHPLLKLSTEKNIHTLLDAHTLPTPLKPLADTFDAAYEQARTAKKLLVNAEKHLDKLRGEHLDLFGKVEEALGGPAAVRMHVGHDHPDYPGNTEMSMHLQWNPTTSVLVSRWLDQFNLRKAAIDQEIKNWHIKVSHDVALNSRTSKTDASKLLQDAGLIHPTTKALLLAGALGLNAMSNPASAANLSEMDDDERSKHMSAWIAGGGLIAAAGAMVFARKFGPAGGKVAMASGRALCGALFEDTASLTAMADKAMASFHNVPVLPPDESLTAAINAWRGKLMQRGFVCPDHHDLLAKCMNGTATPAEQALVTPQGNKFLQDIADIEDSTRQFIKGYVKDWDGYMATLSEADKIGNREINAAVQFTEQVLGGGASKKVTGVFDQSVGAAAAAFARYHFTWNFKIATAGLLHDTLALGGLQLGPGAVHAATFQHLTDPVIRDLTHKIELVGSHSQIRNATTAAGSVKAFAVEKLQNQITFLASLNRQYDLMSSMERHALGCKDARDFAIKAMQLKLPPDVSERVFAQAGLDCAQVTGADLLNLNRSALERGTKISQVMAYARVPMAEQALWKKNIQMVVNAAAQGNFGAALQRMGWMSHALLVKQQFSGARGAVPAVAMASLQAFPFTAEATARVAEALNNYSAGVQTFGDNSAVRWDAIFSPAMATVLPGFDQTIKMLGETVTGLGDIGAMANVLSNRGMAIDDPNNAAGHVAEGAKQLLTASKTDDEVVTKGQKALTNMLGSVGLLFAQVKGVPIRLITNSIQYFPDIINAEQQLGARSLVPIGDSNMPIESKATYEYQPTGNQGQTDAENESKIDSARRILDMGISRRALNHELAQQLRKTMGKDNEVADQIDERAGLSKK